MAFSKARSLPSLSLHPSSVSQALALGACSLSSSSDAPSRVLRASNHVCVAIGPNVVVSSDASLSTSSASAVTVNCGALVTAFAFTPSEDSLLIGTADSRLLILPLTHIFTAPNPQKLIMLCGLDEGQIMHVSFIGTRELVVVTEACVLHRFGIGGLDLMVVGGGGAKVKVESVDLSDAITSFACLVVLEAEIGGDGGTSEMEPRLLVCGRGADPMSIWTRRNVDNDDGDAQQTVRLASPNSVSLSAPMRVEPKKVVAVDAQCVVVLDVGGCLSVWDLGMMVQMFAFGETVVDDFELVPSSLSSVPSHHDVVVGDKGCDVGDIDDDDDDDDGTGGGGFEIVVLSQVRASGRFIAVLSCPDFNVRKRFRVGDDVWLVNLVAGEDVVFFERRGDAMIVRRIGAVGQGVGEVDGGGSGDEGGNAVAPAAEPGSGSENMDADVDVDDGDRVIAISKLLQNVDESMSRDEIKAITTAVQHELSACNDAEQVVRDITTPNTAALTVLLMAHHHYHPSSETSNALRRLDTHLTLRALDADSISDWDVFRDCEMWEVLCGFVGRGWVVGAAIVWRRHRAEVTERIMDIVRSATASINAPELCDWISRDVVPQLNTLTLRTEFVEWACGFAMLVCESPHSALRVVRLCDGIVGGGSGSAGGVVVDRVATPAVYVRSSVLVFEIGRGMVGFERVAELRAVLEDVVLLWDEFGFRVSVKDRLAVGPVRIALDILARAEDVTGLPDAIAGFERYSRRHELDCDRVLVERCVGVITSGIAERKNWEDEALFLVSRIIDAECKSSAVLEIMRHASVPWSDAIDELIRETVKVPGMSVDEVVEQYRLMRLSLVVRRHGFSTACLSLSTSRALLKAVLMRTRNVDAMTDGLLIVEGFSNLSRTEAFSIRLRALITRGLTSRAINLLNTGFEVHRAPALDECCVGGVAVGFRSLGEMVAVGMDVVGWLVVVVDDAAGGYEDDAVVPDSVMKQHIVAVTAAVELIPEVIALHERLTDDPTAGVNCHVDFEVRERLEGLLDGARKLRGLAEEFGVVVGFGVVGGGGANGEGCGGGDEGMRRRVLSRFARGAFGGSEGRRIMPDGSEVSQTALSRLAELLGYERSMLSGIVAEEAAVNGDMKTAVTLTRELMERFPGPSTARTLLNVVRATCGFIAQNRRALKELSGPKANSRLTKWLLELSQNALCTCDRAFIGDHLDAFKDLEALHLIFKNCDSGDYSSLLSRNVFAEPEHGAAGPTGASSSSSSSADGTGVEQGTGTGDVDSSGVVDRYASELFGGVYHEAGLVLSTEPTMDLANAYVVESLAAVERQQRHATSASSTYSASESGSGGDGKRAAPCPVEAGTVLWRELQRNRNCVLAFRIFHRVIEARHRFVRSGDGADANADVGGEGSEEGGQAVALHLALAGNILSSRKLDQRLALGHMLALNDDKMSVCYNLFKKSLAAKSNEHSEIMKLTEVGSAIGNLWSQRAFSAGCEEIAVKSGWANYFRMLGIEFDKNSVSVHGDSGPARALVPEILRKTNFDVVTCLDFARCFNVDDDFVLLSYVSHIILMSKDPDYQPRVVGVIPDIGNKDTLFKTLMGSCFPQISGYDYDRLMFTCSTALLLRPDDADAKRFHLVLEVLTHYSRTNPPCEEENLHEKRALDDDTGDSKGDERTPNGSRRVSFHFLIKDPWRVVDRELNESSINRLVPVINVLGLQADELYRKGVLWWIDHIGQDNAEKVKFGDVKPLLGKIADARTAFDLAARVAQAFPSDAEKIAAHRAAITYGERWLHLVEASGEPAAAGDATVTRDSVAAEIANIRAALSITETEQQLKVLGFNEFLVYARKPLELVERLYFLKGVEAFNSRDTFNLHSVVNDIGKRHSCDVDKLRNMLLTNWMTLDVPKSDVDHLFLPSLRMQLHNALFSNEERSIQTKILYLFESVTHLKAVSFLMATFGSPSGKIKTSHRIRALNVLLQLADPADYEASKMTFEQTVELLNLLMYLLDFEELNIVQTMVEFKDCDKHALARSLWVNKDSEPRVVQLICNICMDHKIYDVQLWENSLARLIECGSYGYIVGMLEAVADLPELAGMNWERIWISVIEGGICYVAGKHDSLSAQIFDRIAALIQMCPHSRSLDVDAMVRCFFSGGVETTGRDLHRALTVLAASTPTESARRLVEHVISLLPVDRLMLTLQQIIDPAGSLNLFAGKRMILDEIYLVIDRRRLYEKLESRNALMEMVRALIRLDKAENVMAFTLRIGRIDDAVSLANMYYAARRREVSPDDALMTFLREHQFGSGDDQECVSEHVRKREEEDNETW